MESVHRKSYYILGNNVFNPNEEISDTTNDRKKLKLL